LQLNCNQKEFLQNYSHYPDAQKKMRTGKNISHLIDNEHKSLFCSCSCKLWIH